ncbi:conserved hypothetical protein [Streptomyces pristinaespiralis ATCC 25486]|jgi:hypothetical protein|uniref:Uncharacterized protein n=2 Tax=Streptomyces pristinaespiralis TaxID=38300 RepID=B5HJP8_STRE2|nr:aspartyl-tRNA synthetase [Streptomyces pristinaespiralis]EDY67059.1 conserved hypothetical protein [Streptomyces pristinaespiralis ATCC 25486]
MGAPTELEEARLRELNIQLRKRVEKTLEKPIDGRPITEAVHRTSPAFHPPARTGGRWALDPRQQQLSPRAGPLARR